MALPTTFAPLTAATLPELDGNFNAVGAMGITACTAAGANAITLTPVANQPAVNAYANYQQFGFVAAASSTSAVTIQVGALPAINLYLADAVTQAGSGSLAITVYYVIVFNSALNSGAGGFQMVSQMPVSNLLDTIGSAQGTIIYRGASSWTALAPGISGQVLQSGGASANVAWANVSGAGSQTLNVLSFASAGAFSFSSLSGLAASTVVKITLIGGGGGGAGGNAGVGGGGGAAAIAIGFISGLTANTFYSGSVGNGGNGGGNATAGSGGGTTTISFGGVQFIAPGGGGGATNGTGGTGGSGSATNTSISETGQPGWAGISATAGGAGATGPWGGGAPWQPTATTAGQNAQGPGSGGGGGQGAAGGGSGATGIFLMEWVQ